MSTEATTGVTVLARLLRRIAAGERLTAAAFAEEEGFARSTVFDVSRQLEEAGFVRRDLKGGLHPGPNAVRLGLAPFGIAALHGPAEALLTLLRDETQGTARIIADDGGVLAQASARRLHADAGTVAHFSAPLNGRTMLELMLSPTTTRAERLDAQLRFERARLGLTNILQSEEPADERAL